MTGQALNSILLHQSFEGLDLPDALFDFLSQLPLWNGTSPDRFVVYTDGSSQGVQQHRPLEWIEECGISDAWAMIVLAEFYATATEPSCLMVVGWTAQQVRCSPSSPAYLGATQVGSMIAEREGLTWAFLWRIGLNCRTPTLFRSDSMLSVQQAQGLMGTCNLDPSFLCLRGAHQLLDGALPHGHLVVEHIYGHTGEPFNDFTDIIAKQESHKSFYLPRPPLHMALWRPKMPYLWMLFGAPTGGPRYCLEGFDVRPPDLPGPAPELPVCAPISQIATQLEMHLSLCTANIQSMYSHPDGYAGKLNYLVEQFQAHGLLIGGLQETRTPQGLSQHLQTLRISSGALRGQGGVELWVNLRQPYCSSHPSLVPLSSPSQRSRTSSGPALCATFGRSDLCRACPPLGASRNGARCLVDYYFRATVSALLWSLLVCAH